MSYIVRLLLKNQNILFVGFGNVAKRKIKMLLKEKANVFVVSKDVNICELGDVTYLGEEFKDEHLDNKLLVFCATNNKKLNREISDKCRLKNIMVNDVSDSNNSSFQNMISKEKDNIIYSVSTKGKNVKEAKNILKRFIND